MQKILWFIIIVSTILFIFSKLGKSETWKGFYYPESGNLSKYTDSPVYSSLQECRDWVNNQINQYNPNGGYDYECGKNCHLKEGSSALVCDETVK